MWPIPGARTIGEVLVEETPGDRVHLGPRVVQEADVLPVYLEYQVGRGSDVYPCLIEFTAMFLKLLIEAMEATHICKTKLQNLLGA